MMQLTPSSFLLSINFFKHFTSFVWNPLDFSQANHMLEARAIRREVIARISPPFCI